VASAIRAAYSVPGSMTSGPIGRRQAPAAVALGGELANVIDGGGRVLEVHTGVVDADIVKGQRVAEVGEVARTAGGGTRMYCAAGARPEAATIAGCAGIEHCLEEGSTTPTRMLWLPLISTRGST
jgi:hypothetical protein